MIKYLYTVKRFFLLAPVIVISLYSCKSCNKSDADVEVKPDTTAAQAQVNSISLPRADTSFIPLFSKILDDAFDASSKKDYNKLAGMIIYRGPDSTRFGKDVFNGSDRDELAVVRLTSGVFNQWNAGVDSRDYARVFDYNQPGAVPMKVLEVIFVSRKKVNRKFFGFIRLGEEWKIADITSSL
jgi:hypothetical protein